MTTREKIPAFVVLTATFEGDHLTLDVPWRCSLVTHSKQDGKDHMYRIDSTTPNTACALFEFTVTRSFLYLASTGRAWRHMLHENIGSVVHHLTDEVYWNMMDAIRQVVSPDLADANRG